MFEEDTENFLYELFQKRGRDKIYINEFDPKSDKSKHI